MAALSQFWLLKTEPGTYHFDQLLKDKKTHWDQVRNFQARNFLKKMKVGDSALIYHSVSEKAIVGLAEVVREAYPDLDPDHKGDWVQVDIKAVCRLKNSVTLDQIKKERRLEGLLLVKQSRLSVLPVSGEHFQVLLGLAGGA